MKVPPRFRHETKFDRVQGFFTWPRLYTDMVINYSDNSVFVEVGVYKGRSLYYLLDIIRKQRRNIKVFGVDHYKEQSDSCYDKTINNLSEFHNQYKLINTNSVSAAKTFQDNSIDFVFIDAGHTYEVVKADILAWLPKIKLGGMMAGHDYNGSKRDGGYPGVRKAVDEIFKRKVIKDYIDEDCWMVKID